MTTPIELAMDKQRMNKLLKNPSGSDVPERAATVTPPAHAFGKRMNHVKPFLTAAVHNMTPVAPVMFIAAMVLTVLAVMECATFVSAFTREIKSQTTSSLAPLVDKKPLAAPDYQSAANVLAKNNSAVQVELSPPRTSIVISIKDPALLPEFVYALVTIQAFRQGVAWSATRLCLSKCEGGKAASTEITGYTQAISFSGGRS